MSVRVLRTGSTSGNMKAGSPRRLSLYKEIAMTAWFSGRRRRIVLLFTLGIALGANARAQIAAASASAATTAWTVKVNGDIRWQQITPAGALLVSTDSALAAVDIDRGRVAWEKPELGGLAGDSIQPVEGSLLMEAKRQGLLMIFDPVTGAVIFDSRKLDLTQVATRRVLPQSGTLLVHGKRAAGPSVVGLFDLASGQQLWVNESMSASREPKKRGVGALRQRLTNMAAESTALEVLQAGPDMIVVHTLLGLRALDARTGNVRWSATLPTNRGMMAQHV